MMWHRGLRHYRAVADNLQRSLNQTLGGLRPEAIQIPMLMSPDVQLEVLQHALVFFVLLVAFVIGLTMHHRLLREMRSRHPDLWESLGRPTLVINNSVSNGLAVQRFLWRKDYEALHDPEFILLADGSAHSILLISLFLPSS